MMHTVGVEMTVPDCLPVPSDRWNIFAPVSTNIQLEQLTIFNTVVLQLFKK